METRDLHNVRLKALDCALADGLQGRSAPEVIAEALWFEKYLTGEADLLDRLLRWQEDMRIEAAKQKAEAQQRTANEVSPVKA